LMGNMRDKLTLENVGLGEMIFRKWDRAWSGLI
jgi:hypothetical protein